MLNQDQVKALTSPFPAEALSKDTSRGFELTSIKAAFVIERLNDVFGLCGIGWRYVHNSFETLTDNGKMQVVTEVAIQYRFNATNDCVGCDPVMWDAQANGWVFRKHSSNHDWSEPIFACGGKQVVKGRITDARKSAVTDGLTKAASMIGVGQAVFKGQVRVGGGDGRKKPRAKRTEQTRSGGNGKRQPVTTGGNGKQPVTTGGNGKADATAFWTLYRSQGQQSGVSNEYAKRLASQENWTAACTELRTLIAKAN